MVNFTAINKQDNSVSLNKTSEWENPNCLFQSFQSNNLNGSYIWSKSEQGFTLSSYFWGYAANQIPASYLALKYGGKNVIGISELISGIFTILSPFCANSGYLALSVCRFFVGAGHVCFS